LAGKPLANAMLAGLASGGAPARAVDLDALLAAPAGERAAAIEDLVRVKVAGVLHLEDADAVEPDIEFVDLGLDSLLAVELKNTLEATFRVPLPASAPFDHPCAARLADFLHHQLVPEPVG
ncbi:MAG TPA: acyl carrier protein, partial [Micromonosporaceae bacterium]|nr:acyl carrier protein [Micromonosporaceae bacterium]